METGDVIWIFEEDQDAEMAAGIDPGENQKIREKIDSSTEEMMEVVVAAALKHPVSSAIKLCLSIQV
jgi:hypothetical protein